jgi:multidrug efflux pump
LPAQVQQTGVRVTKSTSSYLLVIGFVSTDHSMNRYDISNFVASNIQDPLSRVPGVGNLNVFGTQYAMRVWLNLSQLNSFALNPTDVVTALQGQNVQVSAGQLGGLPALPDQGLSATITGATLLRTPEDFGEVLLKVQPDGSMVRLRDVARIGRGPENYIVDSKYNGQPASGIGVQLAPGANALDTADAVRARVRQLAPFFPHGLKVVTPYDVTPFIRVSIEEVVKTLLEGVTLVFLVMYLFLQNFRATLIPSITVPVVLLGAFGVMNAIGFTINTLSMFGLVLAIGLLVDDAIVVVENVERIMHEEGLPPPEATRKAMGQISGALIGVAMVLSAVFVPVAFSPGTAGAIYRQFALTIVVSMLLSVFVALSLTPALCATLLKAGEKERTTGFFGWFNRGFETGRGQYLRGVQLVAARTFRWLAVYATVVVAVGLLFVRLPTSFLPNEDQGYMFVQVQRPPGSTQAQTGVILDQLSDYLRTHESAMVDGAFTVNGNNNAGRGQSQGQLFVHLKDWSERDQPGLTVQALSDRIAKRFASNNVALIFPLAPPLVRGLGNASGFDMELQDRGGLGHDALARARDRLLEMGARDPDLAQLHYNGVGDNPSFRLQVDRQKAGALGVTPSDADQAFSIAWGSRYVNNFLDTDNRIKKVYVQADAPFRMNPGDIDWLYVRNTTGTMVPLSAISTNAWQRSPAQLQRYNGVEAMEILGQGAPGKSTGQAMQAIEKLAAQLPKGIGFEWTGSSLQQEQASAQAPYLYALSMIVVFLSLAALYESWSIPVSVLMVVPIGALGALAATMLRGLSNDVYFQVGLLTTIGLSAKNAILLVEFAREREAEGMAPLQAAVSAAHMRIRPIIMTSMTFVLGVLPLAISRGAGAASQHAIGTGVIGGMLTATFIAPLLIPMFFIAVGRLFGGGRAAVQPGAKPQPRTSEAPTRRS